VRVWMEGVINTDPDPDSLGGTDPKTYPVRPFLMLGSLDIVGSRWQISPVDSITAARGTTVTLNSVNSVDNANIYVPPFDPGQTLNGSQSVARREQSLSMEFTNLGPLDTLSVFRTVSIDEDYTRYGDLNWYVASFDVPGYAKGVDSLYYFVRFSSDVNEGSYYEYRAPLPASSSDRDIHWESIALKLTTLSNLKLNANFPRNDPIYYSVPGDGPGVTYTIVGRPSFTRLRRLSIGLINLSSSPLKSYPTGALWFDEIRATNVAKDIGRAERVLLNGKFANLLGYNLTYTGRDADFLSVGENRGQGFVASQVNFAGTMDAHRFIEGTGLVLPVGYAYTRNTSQPRYSAGDDVVRTDQEAQASQTLYETRSWNASISRAWSSRSNPFLRFTLGGLGATISRSVSLARTPSSVDSSIRTAGAVSYGISPRALLALPMGRVRFYPLPERLFWNYAVTTSESHGYDRLSDSLRTLVPRSDIIGRTAGIAFGGDFRPFEAFHQHFEGNRNLTLGSLNQQWGFINLGRTVNWRQNMDWHYNMNRLGAAVRSARHRIHRNAAARPGRHAAPRRTPLADRAAAVVPRRDRHRRLDHDHERLLAAHRRSEPRVHAGLHARSRLPRRQPRARAGAVRKRLLPAPRMADRGARPHLDGVRIRAERARRVHVGEFERQFGRAPHDRLPFPGLRRGLRQARPRHPARPDPAGRAPAQRLQPLHPVGFPGHGQRGDRQRDERRLVAAPQRGRELQERDARRGQDRDALLAA